MARKLPTTAVCERYGITDRTVDRWVAADILPAPMYINKRRYWDEAEIERRERERMSARQEPSAA
jgi:predicted DNA-binding transcriptional regulator AlpA